VLYNGGKENNDGYDIAALAWNPETDNSRQLSLSFELQRWISLSGTSCGGTSCSQNPLCRLDGSRFHRWPESFRQALSSHWIGLLTGVEITVEKSPDSLHILAYGFDPENRELLEILRRNKMNRHNGFLEDLNKVGSYLRSWAKSEPNPCL
jgi:hypothetical protein